MHSPISSAIRTSDIEQEDASIGDSLKIDVLSVTEQNIFPASPPRSILDDNDRQENERLQSDEHALKSMLAKASEDIALAVTRKACIPCSLNHEAPKSPADGNLQCYSTATSNSDSHAKKNPPLPPTTLCLNSSSPVQTSTCKQERGSDTLSSFVTNRTLSIFTFDHDLEAEDAELPKRKKTKLHNKKRIVTGSGDVEYFANVCQVHAGEDISLPASHCRECRRVNSIICEEINAYEAWLRSQHQNNRGDVEWRKARHRWARTRRALTNLKIELENTTSKTPARGLPPLSPGSFLAADLIRISVRFDPPWLTNEDASRTQNLFDRRSPLYSPGKYSAPKGERWEDTSNPYE
ncbi:hypothetical protein MMC34_003855 [Xylographa carneopallida]|nr:hypothetical protein [Xylographa carneopallida]